jgi:CubicO group peptidase (beta-lactamase class C family)
MRLKTILTIVLIIALFLGERAISFSFKRESDTFIKSPVTIPLSHKITSSLSDLPETHLIDSIIVDFMNKNKIIGASVAIANKGNLVYSKGFGYADKENMDTVTPESIFRIASVSKLVTAVAIMKLVEDEKLDINAQVFGPTGILNDSIYMNYIDKRYEQITIQQLLNHTAGWNGNKVDPVFNSLYIAQVMNVSSPAPISAIIEYALSKKLDYLPGKTYSYSNLGYCILGEVIKKVTGMEYEDYVQFAILDPLGIYDMHIGKSLYTEKFNNEVRYYDKSEDIKVWAYNGSKELVPFEYGGNDIALLGAAGGWVASSTELARLMVAIDGFESRSDILSKKTIQCMTEAKDVTRKLIGWRGTDGRGTWWRTGTLAGTTALVMRHNNDISWVVLLNTTTNKRSHIHNEISRTMFKALYSVKQWPDLDLFNYEPVSDQLLSSRN